MCVGCRRRAPARDLVRIVRTPDGRLVPGRPGRDGRGAWLCRDRLDCLDGAARRGLSRAWGAAVSGEAVAALRAIMAGRGTMERTRARPEHL